MALPFSHLSIRLFPRIELYQFLPINLAIRFAKGIYKFFREPVYHTGIFVLEIVIPLFGVVSQRLDNIRVETFAAADELPKPLPTILEVCALVRLVVLTVATTVDTQDLQLRIAGA
jgi:hypothetical protein